MSEKTEQPTEKKLDDARKKGQVAQSKDLGRLLTCTVLLEIGQSMGSRCREILEAPMLLALSRLDMPFYRAVQEIASVSLANGAMIVLPALMIALLAVLIGTWAQIGFLIAPEALTPKFDKFNPFNNFIQLFSAKHLADFGFSLIKAVLVLTVVWIMIRDNFHATLLIGTGTLDQVWSGTLLLSRGIWRIVLGIFLALTLIDVGLQRYFHIRNLRMSHDDIKQEHKESEGDPHVKGHRRHLAMQLANSPPANTRKSNAVVVNPTHFAVALWFDEADGVPPRVVARGHDDVARQMIDVAREEQIPVIRYVPLARTLYATGREGQYVPRQQLAQVALVYRAIAEMLEAGLPSDMPEIDPVAAEAWLASLTSMDTGKAC
ncbi:type III secretion system export apparatus subunit SctU [Chitinivorax sp. B]|uniref:type III secretion system export apparatus subunit SctU n=1 Tax=Chitinivorax sp. B TaxID=2502235 RepID=UPI0014855CDD|nr:type III secretion system export apparatus subunit SctU [Chitinivorax sp. B]